LQISFTGDETHGWRLKEKIIDINMALKERFKGLGIFIDPDKKFTNHDGSFATQFYRPDHIHLDDLGNLQFFETVARFLDSPAPLYTTIHLHTRHQLNEIKALPRIKTIKWVDYR